MRLRAGVELLCNRCECTTENPILDEVWFSVKGVSKQRKHIKAICPTCGEWIKFMGKDDLDQEEE